MSNNITYQGYSALPSDYECPDGSLSSSLNLISEDNHIKPLRQPATVLKLSPGERVLFVHNIPGGKNYILTRVKSDKKTDILWLANKPAITDTSGATHITTVDSILDVAAVGNSLVLALPDGLKYFMWKDGGYTVLGSKPPFISIDFGMTKVGTLTRSEQLSIPSTCKFGRSSFDTLPSKTELETFSHLVYGLLNPELSDKVTSKGYFYQPFFIRYAYRLYDGTHAWHSAPILMLPSVTPPIIRYDSNTSKFILDVNFFALQYRILLDGDTDLATWSDLVTGIDIFISAPIYTYDQSKNLETPLYSTSRSILLSICKNYDAWSRNPSSSPSSVFIGHYADDINSTHSPRYFSTDGSNDFTTVNIHPHEQFHDNLCNSQAFYKIAEIDTKDIAPMDTLSPLSIKDSDLSNLATRQALTDDYQSHCNLIASSLYAFNSRLNLAGIEIAPAKPFPLRSCTQFCNAAESTPTTPTVTIWTRLNGVKCKAIYTGESNRASDAFLYSMESLPRYIFYPDASAYRMELNINGTKRVIKLTPHNFLNGSYYYNSDFSTGDIPQSPEIDFSNTPASTSVSVGSKIYTSEVNNPFTFPVLGINTVGSGTVLGICSAAKALSQGQFGQFPLYAFTSEGVWALETNSTGFYSARQPITRDVCINPSSITQIDSSVLFATQRGIMLLSGSQAKCISDEINDDTPFDLLSLPGFNKLHAMLGHDDKTCFPIAPFSEFLSSCGMIYDYVHQHIILYSPRYSYAYVYSIKSQRWGMMFSKIIASVNSYPDALAIDKDNNLVNFAQLSTDNNSGLLVTRPLKLDNPDLLKTVDNIIQRGNFRRGHVRSVLYGSRNLINWHLVWSSNDHFLRGFRGTPYKYFRVALLCNLSPGESIFGASVQFTPRLLNTPR